MKFNAMMGRVLGGVGGSLPPRGYVARVKAPASKRLFGRIERSEKPERRRVSGLPDSGAQHKKNEDTSSKTRASIRRAPLCGGCTPATPLLLAVAAITSLGCSDLSNFEGQFSESYTSGRIKAYEKQEERTTMRFHRIKLKQYGNDLGGVVEIFDLPDMTTFSNQPDVMEKVPSYYSCVRLDRAYVSGVELYATYTDPQLRRWRFVMRHNSDDENIIEGDMERVALNNAIIGMSSDFTECENAFLNEDYVWALQEFGLGWLENYIFQRNQIVMELSSGTQKNELNCLDYYKDYEFDVRLTPELASGELCSPNSEKCDNLRLGIFLTRFDGTSVLTSEYLSARLDSYDIDTVENKRSIRLRRPVSLYVSSMKNAAFATMFVYEDENLNGSFDAQLDSVVAHLNEMVLVFAPEASHDAIKSILSPVARAEELLNLPVEEGEAWSWKTYETVSEADESSSFSVSDVYGLGDVYEFDPELVSTRNEAGEGCLADNSANSERQKCKGLFFVGGRD